METKNKQQGKIAWNLDEQAIQPGRELKNHPATAEGRTEWGHEALWSERLIRTEAVAATATLAAADAS